MKNKKYFNYVIIIAVLIIPFMYSFFYLKAYWNPYGKGNIDNLPVAIVNLDKGNKGEQLINNIKEKKTLKLAIENTQQATEGLYNGKYYAIINIPEDFTASMESVASTNKKHATITYSPNQKSNYLASQIIDKVITTVEKNLDNTVNSEIINTLSKNLEEVPAQMNTVNTGFTALNNGTNQLVAGSKQLQTGSKTLDSSYQQFHEGITTIKNKEEELTSALNELDLGINQLASKSSEFTTVKDNLPILTSKIEELSQGSNTFTTSFSQYKQGVDTTTTFGKNAALKIVELYDTLGYTPDELYLTAKGLLQPNKVTTLDTFDTIKAIGTQLEQGNKNINQGISLLTASTQNLKEIPTKLDELATGVNKLQTGSNQIMKGQKTLSQGVNTLFIKSSEVKNGITTLSTGTNTLNQGITTLNTSVETAKNEITTKLDTSKKELNKVNNLTEYSKEPVKIKTEEVNKVSSYGTAFSPLFISIALWIGCLMLYIVLYFDKEERFKKLSINNPNRFQRTLCYHGLATLSAIILGVLLMILLDFKITNFFLYFLSLVLIANMFLAIIQFLIIQFKDIGKFIALILLVLQLAAAGGTFPIETVTQGFRFLHGILPMTYTIRLLKEALVTIESTLLTKNLVIIIIILIVFLLLNLISDYYHQKKNASK